MGINRKYELGDEHLLKIKKVFKPGQRVNFLTEFSETIYFICPETDRCQYYKTVTASCGCCGDIEEREEDLSYILEYMTDEDFNDFVEHIKELQK